MLWLDDVKHNEVCGVPNKDFCHVTQLHFLNKYQSSSDISLFKNLIDLFRMFLLQVITYKLITPSVVSERLKVRASLAKQGLRELLAKGLYYVVGK